MATKNKDSTRYYSDRHEKSICKALGARQQSNSGAGHFNKGDVVHEGASLLIEAKCTMTPKKSVSIKKEWLDKNRSEKFAIRKSNSAVCINFEPDGDNFYIIDEKLMRYLVDKLSDEESL